MCLACFRKFYRLGLKIWFLSFEEDILNRPNNKSVVKGTVYLTILAPVLCKRLRSKRSAFWKLLSLLKVNSEDIADHSFFRRLS